MVGWLHLFTLKKVCRSENVPFQIPLTAIETEEKLTVTVNVTSGRFRSSVTELTRNDTCREIDDFLNSNEWHLVRPKLDNLR